MLLLQTLSNSRSLLLLLNGLLFLSLGATPALAQTRLSPGFNLFSVDQDVEVGRQSAAEVEKQMPTLQAPSVEAYVQRIGARLASVIQGADYPYQFKIINASEINAFALPGGFMYLNRGLIEAADREGELAGVMAHEMAHVALRHGTNQASKAYLAQAGLGVLGGVLGGGSSGDIIGAVGGFGLNTLFLKFSRSAESKADLLGAQTLAKAGYDPMDMVSFFEKLGQGKGRNRSRAEQFFSSHPAPENRARRVSQEINLLGRLKKRGDEGNLHEMQARLERLPAAPPTPSPGDSTAPGGGDRPEAIPLPSSALQTYIHPQGFLRMKYPENWQAYGDGSGVGVTFVPQGGVVNRKGRQEIVEGVLLNHYQPFEDRSQPVRGDALRAATEDLVHQLIRTNTYLEVEESTWRRDRVGGREADSVVLAGVSPATGRQEQISLFTRNLSDGHILYLVFISAADRYRDLSRTFEKMLASLEVDDRKMHQH